MLIFLSMMIFSSYSSDPLVLYTIIVGPNGLDIFEPASLNNLKVGDVLIFNFNSSGHNVRETNGDSCNYNSNGKFIFSINKKIWVKKKNHIIFFCIAYFSGNQHFILSQTILDKINETFWEFRVNLKTTSNI